MIQTTSKITDLLASGPISINSLQRSLLFDFYQPIEQVGFRKGFSTIDHLQTNRYLIEKTTEYNIPIHMVFIDFHNAFDSIETWHIRGVRQGDIHEIEEMLQQLNQES